jgi:membrane protein DedA with SNARE-associated domain
VTPSIVSGVLAMKFRQFAAWNFLAGTVFVVAVGSGAYGAGRVSTGHHDPVSWGMLVGGTAVAVACAVLVRRHHRRNNARRSSTGQPTGRAPSARQKQ